MSPVSAALGLRMRGMPAARRPRPADLILRTARDKLGYDALRPGQAETVRLVLDGRDVLSVMPTGAGKSAIYQIAGLLIDGPTVVISPLIALQKDQLESIVEKGVAAAAVINSAAKVSERRAAFEKLAAGELEFLFLAPEQLTNEETAAALAENPPSLLVVDEAHCISEWGTDFRPEYGRIGAIMESITGERRRPTVLALTATAAPNVRQQIVDKLHLREPEVIVWGFDRPNIRLDVESCPDEETKQRVAIERVRSFAKPGIVYVATHAHAEQFARQLREENVPADFYHGGMKKADRDRVQDAFMTGELPVVVATNAFGMGVDKPDVRFVLHYDIPESVDAYYQEIGRAGRDGQPSEALLLYRRADVGRRRAQAAGAKVDERMAEEIVEALVDAVEHDPDGDGAVNVEQIREATEADEEVSKGAIRAAVQRLEDMGKVEVTAAGEVQLTGTERELTDAAEDVAKAQAAQRAQRLGRVEMMRDYAETGECRRAYLLNYFGEKLPEPCGHCDNCEGGAAQEAKRQQADVPFPLKGRVVHKKWGEGTVLRYEGEKIVILFDAEGEKTVVTDFVVSNALLANAS